MMKKVTSIPIHILVTTLSSNFQLALFRFAAFIGVIPWMAGVSAIGLSVGVAAPGNPFLISWCVALITVMVGLLGLNRIPARAAPSISINLLVDGAIGMHLWNVTPPKAALAEALREAIALCHRLGRDRIRLVSPIFGKPEKHRTWFAAIERTVAWLAPDARVQMLPIEDMPPAYARSYRWSRHLFRFDRRQRHHFENRYAGFVILLPIQGMQE